MSKEHIRSLLEKMPEKEVMIELKGIVGEFKGSVVYEFAEALHDHMICQHLRQGGESLVDYGRLQGMNAGFDLIEFISNYEIPEEPEEEEEKSEKGIRFPSGYGAI